MAENGRQPSDITQVTERGNSRIQHFQSGVFASFENDGNGLIRKRAVGSVAELGEDVDAKELFLQFT